MRVQADHVITWITLFIKRGGAYQKPTIPPEPGEATRVHPQVAEKRGSPWKLLTGEATRVHPQVAKKRGEVHGNFYLTKQARGVCTNEAFHAEYESEKSKIDV